MTGMSRPIGSSENGCTCSCLELVIGTPERFHCGKQIASYVGLAPSEESSGDRRRLGHINKQGNYMLRYLLVEAAQVTVHSQPQWRNRTCAVPGLQIFD